MPVGDSCLERDLIPTMTEPIDECNALVIGSMYGDSSGLLDLPLRFLRGTFIAVDSARGQSGVLLVGTFGIRSCFLMPSVFGGLDKDMHLAVCT
jgi:hypothetical protein